MGRENEGQTIQMKNLQNLLTFWTEGNEERKVQHFSRIFIADDLGKTRKGKKKYGGKMWSDKK